MTLSSLLAPLRPRTDSAHLLRELASISVGWAAQFRGTPNLPISFEYELYRYLAAPTAPVSLRRSKRVGRRIFVDLPSGELCAIDRLSGPQRNTYLYHPPALAAAWLDDLKRLCQRPQLAGGKIKVGFLSVPLANLHLLALKGAQGQQFYTPLDARWTSPARTALRSVQATEALIDMRQQKRMKSRRP